MKVTDIIIGERHRHDMGDLTMLADSIKTEGLLQPLGVTPENELVFGYRRLTACRDNLGWTEIDVRVVNVTSIEAGEYAENEMRKDFTVSERVAILETMERRAKGGDRRSKEYVPLITKREEAASLAGLGNATTARQAKTVVKDGTPELVAAMDNADIKIAAAAIIATKPPDEQKKIVAMPKKQRKAVVRLARTNIANKQPAKNGNGKKTDAVRLAIRDLVECGERVNRSEWAEKLSVGEHAVQIADLLERGRLEGLREAAITKVKQTKRIDPPMLLFGDSLPKGDEIDEPPPDASDAERLAWREKVGAKVVLHPNRIRQLLSDESKLSNIIHVLSRAAATDVPTAEEFAACIERALAHAHKPDAKEPGDRQDFAKRAHEAQRAIKQHLETAIAKLESYRTIKA